MWQKALAKSASWVSYVNARLVPSGGIKNPVDAKTRSTVAFAYCWCRSELESGFKMKIPIKIEDFNRLVWVRRFLKKLSRYHLGSAA
jgi:hypothetical protein